MAFIYVTEYASLGMGAQGQIPQEPPLAEYRVAIGASSASGPAFQAATRFIRVHADAICSIDIGPSPATAVATSNQRFAANQTEFKAVPGGTYAIACITNS